MAKYLFVVMENKKKRPKGMEVEIHTEEIVHIKFGKVERTTLVTGAVFPQGTKGRKSAPEPISGYQVSQSKKVTGTPIAFARNTGAPDLDKGHVMALELGGPDVPANIVPQWSNFQRNGYWKKMETAVRGEAEKLEEQQKLTGAAATLYFNAVVLYKPYQKLPLASLDGLGVPTHLTVTTWVQDTKGNISQKKTVFDAKQEQDKTDDMINVRLFEKADKTDEADDVDYPSMYQDVQVGKKKKLEFVDSGQDDKYRPIYSQAQRPKLETPPSSGPTPKVPPPPKFGPLPTNGLQPKVPPPSKFGPFTTNGLQPKVPPPPTSGDFPTVGQHVTIGPPPIVYTTQVSPDVQKLVLDAVHKQKAKSLFLGSPYDEITTQITRMDE